MSLRKFTVDPFRITASPLCQALDQALYSMAAHARSHCCAGPERGTDQIGIFGAKSDSTVFHKSYDPIVSRTCQEPIWRASGFGFWFVA